MSFLIPTPSTQYIQKPEELVSGQTYIFKVTGQKYLNEGNITDIKNESQKNLLRDNYERIFTYINKSLSNDEFIFTPVEKNQYISQANLRFIPSENEFAEFAEFGNSAILMVKPIQLNVQRGGNKYKRKTLRGKRKRRYTRRRRFLR
jgi:hypothetical protein